MVSSMGTDPQEYVICVNFPRSLFNHLSLRLVWIWSSVELTHTKPLNGEHYDLNKKSGSADIRRIGSPSVS